jgi:hypothetical protein
LRTKAGLTTTASVICRLEDADHSRTPHWGSGQSRRR